MDGTRLGVEIWRGKLTASSPWSSLSAQRDVVLYGVCAELVVPDFGQRFTDNPLRCTIGACRSVRTAVRAGGQQARDHPY